MDSTTELIFWFYDLEMPSQFPSSVFFFFFCRSIATTVITKGKFKMMDKNMASGKSDDLVRQINREQKKKKVT